LLVQNGALVGPEPKLHLREPHDLDVPILLPLGLVLEQKVLAAKPMQAEAKVLTIPTIKQDPPLGMLNRRVGGARPYNVS
jgi:hypothetical protein